MNATRFSHHVLAGAVSAALLAGCSAGSQFTPSSSSAAPQTVAVHQAARGHGVSPDWLMYNYLITVGGQTEWFYLNIWGVWKSGFVSGIDHGSTLGGSATQNKTLDVGNTDGTIAVYSALTPDEELTGLNGVAAGVGTDSRGNTFAGVNASGAAEVQEIAEGSATPTATYTDPNLASISGLAIDKANRVYVEGQSQTGAIEVDELIGSGSFASLAPAGALGATAGGLAVQMSGKTTYVWINDTGNGSDPANIARYEFTGKSLAKQGAFEYGGINGGIAVDPKGKNTTDVYAVNNVASGSQYSVSGIEYAFPSGKVVSQSPAQTATQESYGIWLR